MAMASSKRRYPLYMYHRDFDNPKRVDNNEEEKALSQKGWVATYLHKDYPTMVNGMICKDKDEEKRELAKAAKEDGQRGPGRPPKKTVEDSQEAGG